LHILHTNCYVIYYNFLLIYYANWKRSPCLS